VPIPQPGPGQVLVLGRAGGICGTDLHIWRWDPWAASRLHPPVIIGHEFCGTVAEIGPGAHGVAPGDFVSGECHVNCGRCGACRRGEPHICERLQIIGVNRYRLALAERLGPDLVLDARTEDVPRVVRGRTDASGADVLLEFSGNAQGVHTGLAALRNGGAAALLGLPSRPVELDLSNEVIFKGARLQGIFGRRMWDTWEQATALLASGMDIRPVITHRLPVARFAEAFALMESGECGKVILTVDDGA